MKSLAIAVGLAVALVAFPAATQEVCKVGAQSAFAAAQDYRLAVGKVRTSCMRGGAGCEQLRQEADQLFDALVSAHDVMLEACEPGSGGGTTPNAGELVITEIMVDPLAVDDSVGEWIEFYNPTARALELQGLTLYVGINQQHTIAASVVVPSAGFVVLGRSSDSASNGGVAVSYVYSDITLPNLVLNDPSYEVGIRNGSTVIDSALVTDRVVHLATSDPWLAGRSHNLSSGFESASANDDVIVWCMGATSYGSGDFGTPGYANIICLQY